MGFKIICHLHLVERWYGASTDHPINKIKYFSKMIILCISCINVCSVLQVVKCFRYTIRFFLGKLCGTEIFVKIIRKSICGGDLTRWIGGLVSGFFGNGNREPRLGYSARQEMNGLPLGMWGGGLRLRGGERVVRFVRFVRLASLCAKIFQNKETALKVHVVWPIVD